MTSSGMKRGLAATAVSALAVTGLPFMATSANAQALSDELGAGNVALYTQYTNVASVKNDGHNTTVHLLAGGGSDVQQVRFEYLDGATWTTIATVSRANGAFSTEWAPPASIYNLTASIRAIGIKAGGLETAPAAQTALVSASLDAVDISNAPGSEIGMFEQPYGALETLAVVSGTTSDVTGAGDVVLTDRSEASATTTQGADENVYGEPSGGVRTFSGVVNVENYDTEFDTTDPVVNQIVIGAADDSDDAEALTVYKQTITTVTAVAGATSVPTDDTTDVVVTVLDQKGKAIAGAQVTQDGGAAEYTNALGQVTFTGVGANADGSPATHTYVVDTDSEAGYQSGKDYRRTVTVSEYSANLTTMTASSKDGAAFDFDEYTSGDISLLLKDQNGAGFEGQDVTYQWTVDPFEAGVATYKQTAGTATSDDDGVVVVPFTAAEPGTYTLNAWVESDGNPGQGAGEKSITPLVVKAGEAVAEWNDGNVAQAGASTTKVLSGTYALEDGTALADRRVDFTWSPTGDAVVAPQASQPSGTTRDSDTAAHDTSDANGGFSVALIDPAATPTVNELDGDLTATPVGNVDGADTIEVDFLKSMSPANADDITIDEDQLFGLITPGRPVDLDIQVENADGVMLTDYPVEVSVNKGFLSPDAENIDELVADPAPAEGGLFGEWKSVGTTQTLTTDDDGAAGIVAAIEKDAGFDTDDEVTLTVTVKAGGVTKTLPITFTSESPMNPGDVIFELDDTQSVTVLPKAPTSETVRYNVYTTDQFGNLVDGESVVVSDSGSAALINGETGDDTVSSQLKNEVPAVITSSAVAATQTLTGEWDTDSRTWTDADTTTAGFQDTPRYGGPGGAVKLTDVTETGTSGAINWYVIDYATSSFSLAQEGAESNPVGTTVTMVYKAVDQNGEPLTGIDVRFFRSGPDDLQDGDGNSTDTTDANGEAFYTFQGAKAGTAEITAVPYFDLGGDRVPGATRTDTVSFGGPVNIDALLKLGNQADGDDVARVNAPSKAAGATVKLFKIKKDGSRVLLASKTANARGNAKFVVNDRNGNRFTKYQAKVGRTVATFADWTPRKSVR